MPTLKRMMELDASVRFDGGSAGGTDVVMVDDGALTMGSIGERVRQLQAGLAQMGFAVGDIDAEFGPVTSAAVSAFQSAHGLPPPAPPHHAHPAGAPQRPGESAD